MTTVINQNTTDIRGRFVEIIATTPGKLRLALILATLGSVFLWPVVHTTVSSATHSVQTIGKDTVPSIVAAEQIRASLADMDANAANCFFSHGTREARAAYEKDRHQAADSLVSAANNITYGNEERAPILAMVDGLQSYVGLVETARSKGYPLGMDALRQSSDLMHGQLLPAAEALDNANFVHLDEIYKETHEAIPASRARLWLAGILQVGILLGLQVYLFRRTRRILNIPTAIASVLLLGWLLYVGHALSALESDLKIAKEDAFDSIHALWKTRAVAYDANADESLYLLDRGSRKSADAGQAYDQAFKQNVLMIVNPSDPKLMQAMLSSGNSTAKGFLGDELRNITFDGEKSAAEDAVRTYADYLVIDEKIRQLEMGGQHQEAVDLCTGTQDGQSNWSFDKFDHALTKVLDINQAAFDTSIKHSFSDLAGLVIAAPVVSLILTVLVWIGLLPRLREYAG